MNSNNALPLGIFDVYPLRLELMVLDDSAELVEAAFDPRSLPRKDGIRDINSGTPFLGTEVTSPPFQNRNLRQSRGAYLHWQVPRELTRASRDDSGKIKEGVHPTLPNRWLVCRTTKKSQKAWVVESDYLHQADTNSSSGGIFFPFNAKNVDEGLLFRKLGRTVAFEQWPSVDSSSSERIRLTAMGYGNPAFAAFYPDCQGTLSFFDPEYLVDSEIDSDTTYRVTGWYEDEKQEPESLKRTSTAGVVNRVLCFGALVRAMAPKRAVNDDASSRRSHFMSSSEVRKKKIEARRKQPQASVRAATKSTDAISLGVGNTATEAISALLANALNNIPGYGEKSVIECHLESILMASDLDHLLQDHEPKFSQLRHEKGFVGEHGGLRWIIRPVQNQIEAANADTQPPSAIDIPQPCLPLLDNLNQMQRQVELWNDHIDSLRDRLSSDWHKYMTCAYPPTDEADQYPEPDRVMHLIRTEAFRQLRQVKQWSNQCGSAIATLTERINQILAETNSAITAKAAELAPQAQPTLLQLASQPGPRFWSPRDPVLALFAPRELSRHLPDSNQRTKEVEGPSEVKLGATSLVEFLDCLQSVESTPVFQSSERNSQDDPARLIFVEWEAQLESFKSPKYKREHLTARFAPASGDPDLANRQIGVIETESSSFQGRNLISASPAQVLYDRLEHYLVTKFLPTYAGYTSKTEGTEAEQKQAALSFLRDAKNVVQAISATGLGSVSSTALKAYQLITESKVLCLPLGGFHESLLMRRQAVQVPVADPIGFPEYQTFAKEVRKLVGDLPAVAPVPLSNFRPIREGKLWIQRVRLIDTFGRTYDMDISQSATVAAETIGASSVVLPPRFVQPLRVDFHWLAAKYMDVQSNSHPDSSPVCGWLLPNRLDESFEIYDAEGQCIGSIDEGGNWRAEPGSDHPIMPGEIENTHLREVVQHVLKLARADATSSARTSGTGSTKAEPELPYQQALLQTLNNALEAIDPDSADSHSSLSLLVARPLAVVRASVRFELKGQPFQDHSWSDLTARVEGRPSSGSRGYEEVAIPFRIGEHHLLNDGVAGYWVQKTDDSFLDDTFYAPQTNGPPHQKIVSYNETNVANNQPQEPKLVLSLSPKDPPMNLVMLMDPRGSAHLTSGVVPVKEIRLDQAHYVPSLKRMGITFLTAPLLMQKDQVELSLPCEPGYQWSFLERTVDGWRSTSGEQIKPAAASAAFHGPIGLREGWLKLTPNKDGQS